MSFEGAKERTWVLAQDLGAEQCEESYMTSFLPDSGESQVYYFLECSGRGGKQ